MKIHTGRLIALIILTLGIALLTLSGCATQERCIDKYGMQVDTLVTIDTLIVTRVVKIDVPRDSIITVFDSIPCEDFERFAKTESGSVKVKVVDNVLSVDAVCDSLEKDIEVKDLIIRRLEERAQIITKTKKWYQYITDNLQGYLIAFFSGFIISLVITYRR
jgi:hypothetical protein